MPSSLGPGDGVGAARRPVLQRLPLLQLLHGLLVHPLLFLQLLLGPLWQLVHLQHFLGPQQHLLQGRHWVGAGRCCSFCC